MIALAFVLCALVAGLTAGFFLASKRLPLQKVQASKWSIGIFAGSAPLDLSPAPGVVNPVISAKDVTDARASFVADPFMLQRGGVWHMFFELLNTASNRGEIGLATSADGLAWRYQQVVLREPFHLSYPLVFEWENECYMIPETGQAYAVRLYRATAFPTQWEFVQNLVEGYFLDATVFFKDSLWWMFVTDTPRNDALRLFYASALTGAWQPHPMNPIVQHDGRIARPGGRVITADGKTIRYAQDDDGAYGNRLRAFEIVTLSTTDYAEQELPLGAGMSSPASGEGWNGQGMHHIDAHEPNAGSWIACMDGYNHYASLLGHEWERRTGRTKG